MLDRMIKRGPGEPFVNEAVPPDALRMLVIYDHPLDYPDHWVVRAQYVMRGGAIVVSPTARMFRAVEAARDHIALAYPGSVLVQPAGVDPDPRVFEVYC